MTAKVSNKAKTVSAIFMVAGAFLLATQLLDFSPDIPVEIPRNTVAQTQPKPVRIKIPALGISAPIVDLGLNSDGTLAVPKKDDDVGWFVNSPSPGNDGPSVMVGHLDSAFGHGVFYNLSRLKASDTIIVERADGSTATFHVDSKDTYSQDNFPTEQVYGSIDYPGLRLITCAGKYSTLRGRYSDNLVVYASLDKLAQK